MKADRFLLPVLLLLLIKHHPEAVGRWRSTGLAQNLTLVLSYEPKITLIMAAAMHFHLLISVYLRFISLGMNVDKKAAWCECLIGCVWSRFDVFSCSAAFVEANQTVDLLILCRGQNISGVELICRWSRSSKDQTFLCISFWAMTKTSMSSTTDSIRVLGLGFGSLADPSGQLGGVRSHQSV